MRDAVIIAAVAVAVIAGVVVWLARAERLMRVLGHADLEDAISRAEDQDPDGTDPDKPGGPA